MSAPKSIEAATLLRLLDDGQWRPLEEIRRRLAATVAPGKALRRYETNEANRQRVQGPRTSPDLSDDEKIASGQRAIAGDVINSLKKRYVELGEGIEGIEGTDGPQIRRRAQVVPMVNYRARPPAEQPAEPAAQPAPADDPAPAQAVTDPGPPGNPAVAFFDAEQVRAMIAEEISAAVGSIMAPLLDDALDVFQRGMQHWLVGRFAELERQLDHRHSPDRRYRPPASGTSGQLPRTLRRH